MFDRIHRSVVPPPPPPDDEAGIVSDMSASMSFDTRVQLFGGCFLLSIISSICASMLLVLHRITGFCVLTSVGSLLSLCSTCFLMGPITQIKKMFDSSRWLATLIYLLSIAATLVAGLVWQNAPMAIAFTVVQYLAMAWYSLSYIPYARDFVAKLCCNCL